MLKRTYAPTRALGARRPSSSLCQEFKPQERVVTPPETFFNSCENNAELVQALLCLKEYLQENMQSSKFAEYYDAATQKREILEKDFNPKNDLTIKIGVDKKERLTLDDIMMQISDDSVNLPLFSIKQECNKITGTNFSQAVDKYLPEKTTIKTTATNQLARQRAIKSKTPSQRRVLPTHLQPTYMTDAQADRVFGLSARNTVQRTKALKPAHNDLSEKDRRYENNFRLFEQQLNQLTGTQNPPTLKDWIPGPEPMKGKSIGTPSTYEANLPETPASSPRRGSST